MDNEQNLDYLSEDVQEILSTPPSWVMTWGTAAIVMVLFLMGIVGYFFKYPEMVSGRVELTTPLPPEPVIAIESMTIAEFLKKEGEEVETDELLAIRDNAAVKADVFDLERDVKQLLLEKERLVNYEVRNNLQLGEISRDYFTFINSFKKFSFEEKDDFSEQRMRELDRKRRNERKKTRSLEERLKVAKSDLVSAEKQLRLKQTEYSKADSIEQRFYENELYDVSQDVKDKKKEIAVIQQEISSSYLGQSEITIKELEVQYESESSEKQTLESLIQSLQLLQSSIENWKTKNLIHAPISGKVTFFGQDLQSKVFQANQEILYIITKQEEEKYIGNIRLPILKTVKQKEGQEVRLKFDRYPFREWGYVVGKIGKMTHLQREEESIIQVDLPSGLVTNKEKEIPFQYSMGGKAEVVTADKRFITRMLDEFF